MTVARTNLTLLPGPVQPTHADAVTAGPDVVADAAAAGVPVHVRVANPREGRLQQELARALEEGAVAVLLAETRAPQDLRDLDVELRRQELRLGLAPGSVGVVPEIGSALAVSRLGELLRTIDRLVSVGIDVPSVAADLGAPSTTDAGLQQGLLLRVALEAAAARVPWTVGAMEFAPGERAALASRARALGAAGVYVRSEAEVAGFNALFAR